MKSSTLRRSSVTRDKIKMLSALADYNNSRGNSNADIVDKQAALDLLWQNFKVSSTPENSPKSFFIFGFVSGVVVAVIAMTLFNFIFGSTNFGDININSGKASDNVKFTFVPADKQQAQEEATVSQDKEYVVQSGDSLEDISMRFYGSFDESKLKAIQVKNNLPDLNSIKIGQKLIIPMMQNNQPQQ